MARYTRVLVTQEDIDEAIRANSAQCVVAQAIARTIPDASRISVDVQTVRYTDASGTRRVYLTPVGVEQYVIAFDAGDKIEPFGFGLYETQRVNVPTKRRTESGKKRVAAKQREKYAEDRVAKLEADPETSPVEVAAATERLTRARTEVEEVVAETQGEAWDTTTHPEPDADVIARTRTAPRAAPIKGSKSTERHYGHRTMRINREKDASAEPAE